MSNLSIHKSSFQIKIGALFSYITIFVNILTSLLITPWIVKSIGESNYGLYVLVTSVVSLFVLDFGLSAAVTRFTSKYHAEGNQEQINKFLGVVYKLYILIDIFIIFALTVGYFLLDNIYANFTVSELESFKTIYIIMAIYSTISFPFITLNGILSAYEEFIYLKICDLIHKIITVTLLVLVLFADGGLNALVIANALSGLTIILIKLTIIKNILPIKIEWKYKSKKILKQIFFFSIWITLGSIAGRLMFSITPTILGMTTGPIAIALFGIAALIEGYTFTIASALNGLFLPKVSRIIKDGKESIDILPLMIKVGRIQLMIIGLLTVGFVVLGKEFIILWMGDNFTIAYYCAIVLIIPAFISLPQEIGNTTAIASNKVKQQSYIYISMAIINLPLAIILSMHYGAFGAALSISIAYLFRTVLMNILYYNVLNINIFKFFKECYLKLFFPMFLTLLAAWGIKEIISPENLQGFIFNGFIIVIAYFIFMWTISFNDYEKNLFYNFRKKIFRKFNKYIKN